MLPQHRRGKGRSTSTETYMKYGAIGIFILLCIKLLFFVDPLSFEDILPFENKTMYKFTTKYGHFTVELFPKNAPLTVAHFEELIKSGFYKENAGFYRAEPGFVVQGGGFVHDKLSPLGNVAVEYSLPSEERMVVLARNQDPASGNTEFSVMLADNTAINAPQGTSPGFTAFGRIHSGYSTILTVASEMAEGYLAKKNKDQVVSFDSIEKITALAPLTNELRAVSDAVYDAISTRFSVVLFGKTTCPYCKTAKRILKEIGAEVHVIELDLLPPTLASQYQDTLEAYTGRRTVPNVILDGKSIGGGDDVEDLHDANKLAPLVEATGALAKQKVILESIREHSLVVFTKSYDPYSKEVQEVLQLVGAVPHVIEIDTHKNGDAILYNLAKMTGRKTTPNVFVNGKTIGGCDDTKQLHATGELTLLLQQAGAINLHLFMADQSPSKPTSLPAPFQGLSTSLSTSIRDNMASEKIPKDERRVLTTMSVACLCYFTVSGGPVGSEGIISAGGPLIGVLSLVVFPFTFCIPIALLTAELSTAFPNNGGFTLWVHEAFGPFWAFQEGHCCLAIKDSIRHLIRCTKFLGVEVVGNGMVIMCVFVTLPYALFAVWAFVNATDWSALGQVRYADTGTNATTYISTGNLDIQWSSLIAMLFWNYNNFANVSAFAGEVRDPEKAYPRALMIMVVGVILTYLIPLSAAIVWNSNPLWPSWIAGSFVDLAQALGGTFLVTIMAIAYMCSNCGLYSSSLFCSSFLLTGMAESGLAPMVFSKRSAKSRVPYYSVGLGFVIIIVLAGLDFSVILTMCNILSAFSQMLLIAAAIRLRISNPQLVRPFRVPGTVWVMVAMSIAPCCLCCYLSYSIFTSESTVPMYLVPAMIILGIIYAFAMKLTTKSFVPPTLDPIQEESA